MDLAGQVRGLNCEYQFHFLKLKHLIEKRDNDDEVYLGFINIGQAKSINLVAQGYRAAGLVVGLVMGRTDKMGHCAFSLELNSWKSKDLHEIMTV